MFTRFYVCRMLAKCSNDFKRASTYVYKNRNPRVIFNKHPFDTRASVVHKSSRVVVSASTEEPSIRKHLYSCTDVSASENIGRILAYRCHQCGLTECFFDTDEFLLSNETVKVFYNSLIEGGLTLNESPAYEPPEPIGIDYDSLTEEEKRSMYDSLIKTLRTTPDWDNISYPYSLRPQAGRRKLKSSYQILSKVRQGMVWDEFYHRMVHPKDKAYWQCEFEKWQTDQLESKAVGNGEEEEQEQVHQLVPVKWQIG